MNCTSFRNGNINKDMAAGQDGISYDFRNSNPLDKKLKRTVTLIFLFNLPTSISPIFPGSYD